MIDRHISTSEVSTHNTQTSSWLVIDGVVWDITSFAPRHPGGADIIYKYAGRDATAAYNEIHSASIIKNGLPADARKGVLDPSTISPEWTQQSQAQATAQRSSTLAKSEKPPLDSIINLHDFELAAQATASAKTWAFYTSASNDLITRNLNASLFPRILFRPRVMRKVDRITTNTSLIGHSIPFPLFISPAAMARLIHPDGELAIARACQNRGIIQAISNNASYAADEIVSQKEVLKHPFIFQLYVNRERVQSEKLLARILAHSNIKGIMVTTDAAAAGKREADERVKADESIKNPMMTANAKNDKRGGGYGRLMGSFIDPNLCWEDVEWLRSRTKEKKLPLFLKGVMSADDVKMAVEYGLDGVVLSNHGGRNLDTSPPAVVTLLEIHRRFPEVLREHHPRSVAVREGRTKAFAILVDGGIRRGSDILKCVCLGAVACGVGRPALFATGYGQEGVENMIDILRDEFEVAMRNNGITSIGECGPEYVNTGDVDALVPKLKGHEYATDWRDLKAKL